MNNLFLAIICSMCVLCMSCTHINKKLPWPTSEDEIAYALWIAPEMYVDPPEELQKFKEYLK